MSIIIGISGKKQAGKSTLCTNLIPFCSCTYNSLYDVGCVYLPEYSFADLSKQNICIDVMGLSHEQCYGTDKEKNSLTDYKWENLPKEIRLKNAKCEVITGPHIEVIPMRGLQKPTGFMTAREIMQVIATDIFRKYFDENIWVKATFRKIKKDNPHIVLISDVRFPGEVDSIIDNGGYVIRLLRNVCKKDIHESEIALDDYDFSSWGKRCCVINNQELTIEETNKIAFNYVKGIMKTFKGYIEWK